MSGTLKANFRVSSRLEAFYTGGKVQVSSDGQHIFCTHGDAVQVINSQTGKTSCSIKDDAGDEVTSFAVTADDQILIIAYRNSLIKQWNWKEATCTRTWQSLHRGPVVSMAFDATSTLLATGSSDGTIKIWDIIRQYCTHNLRGSQGVVSIVQFHPSPERLHLFSVSDDNNIRIWDLQTSSCMSVLKTHYGAVTSLDFSRDGNTLLSSGRDSVVVIWDLIKNEPKKTIPVFETLESVLILPDNNYPHLNVGKSKSDLHFLTAGAKGVIKVWDVTGQCLYTQKGSPLEFVKRKSHQSTQNQDDPIVITQATLCKETNSVAIVTYDHNIVFFGLEDLNLQKQFVGYNEEILDLRLMGKKETHLAVASNSEQIRIYELGSGSCQILRGHTDIVLALDVFKKGLTLVSSSKDNTIRIWQMDPTSFCVSCVAVGLGHTHSVGTVTASRLSTKFCVSGSEDCTLKVWKIPEQQQDDGIMEPVHMKVIFTEKAHDKDINSVCISPNDKLLATGSQDRVAKLWHLEKEVLLGSFRGHRRGIWCVQFSPTDQALATSSADGSIKIWALSDFSCVKTFEGHDASVLKVVFLTRGMQLLSSGSDGLLKLWTIKTNECVKTLDEHSDKVWAVVSDRSEQTLVTAGSDSSILIWQDVTQIEEEEQAEKEEDQILKEQKLSNLMHNKKYTKALGLAIILDQPFKALGIIKTILEEPGGEDKLESTITGLRPDQIESILKFVQAWNTNSKHCHVAQAVVNLILRTNDPDDLVKFPGFKQIMEGLLPYTERHFQRLSRLLQQASFVQYTWQVMRRASGLQESVEESVRTPEAGSIGNFFLDRTGGERDTSDSDSNDEEEEEEEEKKEEEHEEQESNFNSNVASRKHSRNKENGLMEADFDDGGDADHSSDDDDEEEEEEEGEDNSEEEKENILTAKPVAGDKRTSKHSQIAQKQRRTKISKQTTNDEEDTSDEEAPPSPRKPRTRQTVNKEDIIQTGRHSKRKSSGQTALASGKVQKKSSSPSPYRKKLRRPSRK